MSAYIYLYMSDIFNTDSLYRETNTINVASTTAECYRDIKERIRIANASGQRRLIYDLPSTFTNVTPFTDKEASIIIYSDLLEKLKNGGFSVGYIDGGKNADGYQFIIEWPVIMEETERKRRLELLAAAQIRRKQ
jgi:hypothetical protein